MISGLLCVSHASGVEKHKQTASKAYYNYKSVHFTGTLCPLSAKICIKMEVWFLK